MTSIAYITTLCQRILLACTLSLWLSACLQAHTQTGTETGNPPMIDPHLVTLAATPESARLMGAKGAVTPGGAAIEITNLTTGKVTKTTAAADGSFDMVVTGGSGDSFSVRASAAGKQSAVVYVVGGGTGASATVGTGSDGALSCAQRETLASAVIARTVADADTSCTSDTDCGSTSTIDVCHDACSDTVASKAGIASIAAAMSSIDSGLCVNFTHDGCSALALPCMPPIAGLVPRCVASKCVLAAPDATQPTDCTQCAQDSIQWGSSGSFAQYYTDRSQLAACSHYTRQRVDTRVPGRATPSSCTSELSACSGTASRGALQAALSNADVVQALADSPVTYGFDATNFDGSVFVLTLGGKVINVGMSCSIAQTPCVPIPNGIQALVDVLNAIDTDRLAQPECRVFSAACQAGFAPGAAGASGNTTVYWHDPESLGCLPRTYLGGGGNDNRFATQAECEAQCGTPSAADCGSARTLTAACPACGVTGGCAGEVSACATPCTSDSACTYDTIGTACTPRHVCEVTGCL